MKLLHPGTLGLALLATAVAPSHCAGVGAGAGAGAGALDAVGAYALDTAGAYDAAGAGAEALDEATIDAVLEGDKSFFDHVAGAAKKVHKVATKVHGVAEKVKTVAGKVHKAAGSVARVAGGIANALGGGAKPEDEAAEAAAGDEAGAGVEATTTPRSGGAGEGEGEDGDVNEPEVDESNVSTMTDGALGRDGSVSVDEVMALVDRVVDELVEPQDEDDERLMEDFALLLCRKMQSLFDKFSGAGGCTGTRVECEVGFMAALGEMTKSAGGIFKDAAKHCPFAWGGREENVALEVVDPDSADVLKADCARRGTKCGKDKKVDSGRVARKLVEREAAKEAEDSLKQARRRAAYDRKALTEIKRAPKPEAAPESHSSKCHKKHRKGHCPLENKARHSKKRTTIVRTRRTTRSTTHHRKQVLRCRRKHKSGHCPQEDLVLVQEGDSEGAEAEADGAAAEKEDNEDKDKDDNNDDSAAAAAAAAAAAPPAKAAASSGGSNGACPCTGDRSSLEYLLCTLRCIESSEHEQVAKDEKLARTAAETAQRESLKVKIAAAQSLRAAGFKGDMSKMSYSELIDKGLDALGDIGSSPEATVSVERSVHGVGSGSSKATTAEKHESASKKADDAAASRILHALKADA
jgi:hypothetical protein